ncbi:MAG: YegP family protein [Sphingomonadales bacterium]
MGKFIISRDQSGAYRFVLKAGNGEVVATSQSYKTKEGCKNGISSVRRNAANSPVIDVSERIDR